MTYTSGTTSTAFGVDATCAAAGAWHYDDPANPKTIVLCPTTCAAVKADPKAAPALQFDCGTEDRYGLYAGNEDLHRRLEARHVPHEFALLPGDHGYEFVKTVLEGSLRFLGNALAPRP